MAEIPKPFGEPRIGIGWPRTLLSLSVVFFVLAFAGYFVLAGYEKVIVRQSRDLDKEIQDLAASLSPDEIQKLLTLDSQIKSLKELLPRHTYFSRIFEYVESHTLPRTRFTSITASTKNNRITLQGIAPDSKTASLQAAAFSRAGETVAFEIKNAGAGPGGFTFSFDILFNPSLILPR